MFSNFSVQEDTLGITYRNDNPVGSVFHSHTYYEVYYFHSGSCNYLIGGNIYMLQPGDLILMNGMTLHCPKVDTSVPYIRTTVHFEPAVLKPFLELPHAVNMLQPFQELKNCKLSLRGGEKEEAERILLEMHTHHTSGGIIGYNRLHLAFVDLLYFIHEQCLRTQRTRREFTSEKERHVQRIVSFLEEHYAEDLQLEHLQKHLNFSKFYLSKIFKEITGLTIFHFIYRRRINEAKTLFMHDPTQSVTGVCLQVGFKHLAHFSRLFKQQIGLTPEKYKKIIRDSLST
ncbi:AraC family transcriptional regulator [Paenibacillus lutrae]|uniref:Helix-turn-helix domain-containing protein n=1 Tax=Paenibacillus lutrae TaxID=2078573 RepID=A0A7X3FKK8_9BACL|nr:AraC family transcriptional regulator [Paenibacillus lutrae]MVP01332.1 helix-turn-helix domain-containing protein [Paenibacillus lutrae]